MSIVPDIYPAATDGRFLLQQNYIVYGFSPIINTPVLMHDHNEFVYNKTFIDGIRIYENLIKNFANYL